MLTRYLRNITLVLLLTFGMGKVHAQEVQSDIDFLKEVQAALTKGVVKDAINMMKDSVGINIYPAFHITDDSALWPYALELYFDVRIERKEPYVLVKLNLNPSTGKWTDFSSYSLSVSLIQGQQKAVPTTVLVAAEKQLNEILANIGNLREYFGKVRDNIAETIQKLRFAMMDKYWEGRKLPLVTFYPAPGSLYGFDPPVKEAIISKYQNFYRYDTIIRAPWKALSITKPDKVQAYIQVRDTAFKTSQVRFVNRGNTLLQPLHTNNDTLVFMLTGTSGGNVDEITAEYFATDATGKERKAPIGQVKTVSYEEKTDILYIVPVNGATYPGTKNELEKYLNAVYGQAVTNWEVKFAAGIKVTGWDLDRNDTLNIQTSMFQRYSDEEQTFIDVMEKQAGYDPKAVYLFVTNIPNSLEKDNRTRVLGYMPLNAQYGFLFTSKNALGSNAEKEIYNRTTAHELGHGIYKLSHTWEEYAMMPGSSENLMDYNNGSALWKTQWDWIHDPGVRLYMFQKAAEGAMAGKPLVTFEWKAPPSSGTVTYITPSGLPITIEDATSCFIATEDNAGFSLDNDGVFDNTPEGKTFSFYTDKGPLFGFEKDNKKWFAIFSQSYFYGYYNKESKEYYTESTTENIAASPYITYVWESSGWTAKNCCLKITDYESIKLQNDPGYKGAGYFETDAINRPEATCYVPKAIEQLTEASFSELYVGEAWAKYNHFGDGGILYKVTLDGTNGYLYQNKDNKGNEYWLIYDKNAKHWKKFNYPGFRASDLLNLDFVGKIAQETGHTALDVIGVIPVIGEAADFINGIWYTVEGDALNASLCYASMIPIIGDAVFKGSKVVIKGIKSAGKAADIAKGLDKAINLTEQTSEVFVKIGKSLNAKSVANINECLYETGVLLTKHGDKAADLEKLLSAVPTEKLHAVLKKLNALEDGARVEFLTAIKYAENLPASHLAKNLDKIDEGVIGAWASLKNIGLDDALKCDIEKLDNLGSFAKRTGKSTDEIVADIAKYEDGPEQFLDELGSTSRSGHWDKNPFQRGRDIEDELGQNLPETFKTLDKYEKNTGEATSIKSLDLDAKTYQTTSKLRSRLNKYLDELDKFEGYSLEDVNIGKVLDGMPVNSKTLELAIPRAATGEQLNVINEIIANAASRVSSTSPNGINVKIVVK